MSIQKVDLALTAAGQALRAKIEAGSGTVALEITRIVTASGTSDDPLNLTDVVNRKQEFTITERSTKDARTTIKAVLTNIELSEGYSLSQIGFFALDPDEGEILYRISQFDAPNYVPASTERGWKYEPSFNFITGNAKDVIVNIDPAGVASIERLAEEIAKHNTDPNAHANLAQKIVTEDVIIPTTGWEQAPSEEYDGLYVDVAIDGVTDSMIPIVSIIPSDVGKAAACGFCGSPCTKEGVLRIYAQTAPAQPIGASVALLTVSGLSAAGELLPATATRLGGVKVQTGSGLSVDSEGNLALDSATDEEVDSMIDEVYG